MPYQQPNTSSRTSAAAPGHSHDLQLLLHSLQSILNQIDGEYEREHHKLSHTLPNAQVKMRVLAMLDERHWQRREPHLQQMAILRSAPSLVQARFFEVTGVVRQ